MWLFQKFIICVRGGHCDSSRNLCHRVRHPEFNCHRVRHPEFNRYLVRHPEFNCHRVRHPKFNWLGLWNSWFLWTHKWVDGRLSDSREDSVTWFLSVYKLTYAPFEIFSNLILLDVYSAISQLPVIVFLRLPSLLSCWFCQTRARYTLCSLTLPFFISWHWEAIPVQLHNQVSAT